jgi:hypothetical protein
MRENRIFIFSGKIKTKDVKTWCASYTVDLGVLQKNLKLLWILQPPDHEYVTRIRNIYEYISTGRQKIGSLILPRNFM